MELWKEKASSWEVTSKLLCLNSNQIANQRAIWEQGNNWGESANGQLLPSIVVHNLFHKSTDWLSSHLLVSSKDCMNTDHNPTKHIWPWNIFKQLSDYILHNKFPMILQWNWQSSIACLIYYLALRSHILVILQFVSPFNWEKISSLFKSSNQTT